MKSIFKSFMLLLLISYICKYEANAQPNGYIGYWSFNNTSDDLSGNNLNGVESDLEYVYDRNSNVNSAAEFNGSSSNLVLADDGGLLNLDSEGTVAFWFKQNGVPGGTYHSIYERFDLGTKGLQIYIRNTGILGVYTNAVYESNFILSDNNWHHYAITLSVNKIVFYIDGIMTDEILNTTLYSVQTPSVHRIGKHGASGSLNGVLDELIFYDRILTPEEIGTFTGLRYNSWKYTNNNNAYFIDGNVSIGTVTSQDGYNLSVQGKIITDEVKVTLDGWPDFVFKDNYALKDLVEVENYIKINNHLPHIPSEREVLENGIQIGEMNAKLLQKIEELTLYMIELNKEVKALKEKNGELEIKIKQMKAIE